MLTLIYAPKNLLKVDSVFLAVATGHSGICVSDGDTRPSNHFGVRSGAGLEGTTVVFMDLISFKFSGRVLQ